MLYRSPKTVSSCFLLFIPLPLDHSKINSLLLFLGLISGIIFIVLFFSGKNDPEKSKKKPGNGGNGGNEENPKNPDILPPPPANNANDIIDIA